MSKWQPIETAPRDGTTIRVRVSDWLPYYASWRNGGWNPVEFNFPRTPTHWMPDGR